MVTGWKYGTSMLLWQRTRVLPRFSSQGKVLETKRRGRTRRSKWVYRVKSTMKNKEDLLVADMDEIAQALDLGKRISEMTGLLVKNEIRQE